MTVKEAATALEVSPTMVYRLCTAGKIAHRRIGVRGRGSIRIDPEQLDEFKARCLVDVDPAGPEEPARRARPNRRRAVDEIDLARIVAEGREALRRGEIG